MAWIAELQRALNGGALPEGYYALVEPTVGAPLQSSMLEGTEEAILASRRRRIAIRRSVDDQFVTSIEPTAVGETLIDMPLFLDAEHYVNIPLEATYNAAYATMPVKWRSVLDGRSDQ